MCDQSNNDSINTCLGKQEEVDSNNDTSEPTSKICRHSEHSSVVAAHYNQLEQKGLSERSKSPIFHLRNFNNWVKSVLIAKYVDELRSKDYGRPIRVLDICCGKGGDINKWQKARVEHVVFADIAAVSVEQCKERYNVLKNRCHRLFTAEFIATDCSKDSLRKKYKDPSIKFDLVSCQFGLHYSFESYNQAKKMLTNISECLRPDGYFIGTIPDANEIVARTKKSKDGVYSNRILQLKLLLNPEDGFPLFNAKYDFHLEGVVDCPEFLVNFDLLVKLAAELGLELVYKAKFAKLFEEHKEEEKQLLRRTMSLESYPAPPGKELISNLGEYTHASQYLSNKNEIKEGNCIGTLSQSEWEAITIYIAFAFRKCKSSWDENSKPVYKTSKSTK